MVKSVWILVFLLKSIFAVFGTRSTRQFSVMHLLLKNSGLLTSQKKSGNWEFISVALTNKWKVLLWCQCDQHLLSWLGLLELCQKSVGCDYHFCLVKWFGWYISVHFAFKTLFFWHLDCNLHCILFQGTQVDSMRTKWEDNREQVVWNYFIKFYLKFNGIGAE